MRYIKVRWTHSLPNEPTFLYSELDDHGWETRKVEIFPDGRIGFASASESAGSTRLGDIPVPPLAEIAAEGEFEPLEISQAEFEKVWAQRNLQASSAGEG